MGQRAKLVELAAITLLWACAAMLTLFATRSGGAIALIWLPSGVSVAVLFALPKRRWLAVLAAIGATSVAVQLYWQAPLAQAAGFTVAHLLEVVVTATLARRAAHGKPLDRLDAVDFFALAGAALVGAMCSAAISSFFQPAGASPLALVWWLLAALLGTMIVAPVGLALLARFRWGRRARLRTLRMEASLGLLLVFLCCFATAYFTLVETRAPLIFLMLVATVFAVMRHGQLGATVGILATALAGMIVSLGGNSPMAFLPVHQLVGAVGLQVVMGIMLATCFPLAALLVEHDRLGRHLGERNLQLKRNLSLLGMAERIGEFGRWRYAARTGNQEWSRQLLDMLDLARDGGDAPLKACRQQEIGRTLISAIQPCKHHDKPYSVQIVVDHPDGDPHILKLSCQNDFDSEGRYEGVMAVVRDTTEETLLAEKLSRERGDAIAAAEQARELALTDPLTQLPNRRCLMEELERAIERRARSSKPLGCVIFDIDHFKQVNDTHGHQTGDEVLKRVAQLARRQVRDGDMLGRVGGEEFVWLLHGASPAFVYDAAERLRAAIAEGSGADGAPPVTVSMGIASWEAGMSVSALYAKADAALYAAKEAGRDRIRLAA